MMSSNRFSIRQTSSSYEIYPIEEKQQIQEEFQPYRIHLLNKVIPNKQTFICKNKTIESASLDSSFLKRSQIRQRLKRSRTLTTSPGGKAEREILQVSTKNVCLPHIIHSNQRIVKGQMDSQETANRKKMQKIQSIMQKCPPLFFDSSSKDINRSLLPKPRIINLGALSNSNIFLSHISSGQTLFFKQDQTKQKQLKKLLVINKAGSKANNNNSLLLTVSNKQHSQ